MPDEFIRQNNMQNKFNKADKDDHGKCFTGEKDTTPLKW